MLVDRALRCNALSFFMTMCHKVLLYRKLFVSLQRLSERGDIRWGANLQWRKDANNTQKAENNSGSLPFVQNRDVYKCKHIILTKIQM